MNGIIVDDLDNFTGVLVDYETIAKEFNIPKWFIPYGAHDKGGELVLHGMTVDSMRKKNGLVLIEPKQAYMFISREDFVERMKLPFNRFSCRLYMGTVAKGFRYPWMDLADISRNRHELQFFFFDKPEDEFKFIPLPNVKHTHYF